jgi:hypothetical protein
MPDVPLDLLDRIRQLEDQLRQLQGRAQIRPALTEIQGGDVAISQGGRLIVATPSGQQILYIGKQSPSHPDGSDQQGLVVRRETGEPALSVWTAAGSGAQPLQVYDQPGNVIFADDLQAGGLARPYLSTDAWFGATESPAYTTTSGSFVTLQHLPWIKQHPKVTAFYLVQTAAGTTGEIRLVDDSSNVVVGPITIAAGAFFWGSAQGSLPGSFLMSTTLHWQARTTGGTGTIGVKGLSTFGVQS